MKKFHQAFSMIELVFVIVVIGILASIAIPRLAATRDDATIAKARTTLASVRGAIGAEKQKRILKGDFTAIGDLGDTTYAFNKFDDANGSDVLGYPVKNCATGKKGCWERSIVGTQTEYTFKLPTSGTAVFELSGNKLTCKSTSDCSKLED